MVTPDSTTSTRDQWIPIESDPGLMTDYLRMGSLSNRYVIDIPSIDAAEEMGIFEAHNILAYIFLFDDNKHARDVGIPETNPANTVNLFFMRQIVGNSCGSVALYHAFLNTIARESLEANSLMGRFYLEHRDKSPEERCFQFESSDAVYEMHHETAMQGQSNMRLDGAERDNYHFVAFVPHQGRLYELDGQQETPIMHGLTTVETFKTDALQVIKHYMLRDPDNYNFSVVALCSPK